MRCGRTATTTICTTRLKRKTSLRANGGFVFSVLIATSASMGRHSRPRQLNTPLIDTTLTPSVRDCPKRSCAMFDRRDSATSPKICFAKNIRYLKKKAGERSDSIRSASDHDAAASLATPSASWSVTFSTRTSSPLTVKSLGGVRRTTAQSSMVPARTAPRMAKV
ncbi:hypothetical protein MPTK1_4g03360 [Marchantia polymorpha subsp. ruderalis]|uniref:Uncharacterized protein n=2 Tax=Marchantia polymorpha TaxID=3197 RepID=A0AAF6B5U2_MARPO|nr:hypothetical protein MARPO_0228s0001 [Marchantia polymorpha]BBN07376.1 hypothetical protein Mp_4g03360 [Marchantia polymorpha subsp. ruderalis]|eukprot:PTQ27064.1 hypothetical protein MARPO_0228s0001 [Marchantia polymorpha]